MRRLTDFISGPPRPGSSLLATLPRDNLRFHRRTATLRPEFLPRFSSAAFWRDPERMPREMPIT